MNNYLFEILSLALTTLTGGGILGLFVGRKQRRAEYQDYLNKALKEQQESINMFSKSNNDLLEELVSLRKDYAIVRDELQITKLQNEQLLSNQNSLQEQMGEMEQTIKSLIEQLNEAGIEPKLRQRKVRKQ